MNKLMETPRVEISMSTLVLTPFNDYNVANVLKIEMLHMSLALIHPTYKPDPCRFVANDLK